MSTSNDLKWTAALIAVGLCAGCAYGEMREILRSSLASQLECPEMRVEPRTPPQLRTVRPDDNQYRVTGCGVVRMYTCPPNSGLQEYGVASRCTFIEGNPDEPETASLSEDDDEPMPSFTE